MKEEEKLLQLNTKHSYSISISRAKTLNAQFLIFLSSYHPIQAPNAAAVQLGILHICPISKTIFLGAFLGILGTFSHTPILES